MWLGVMFIICGWFGAEHMFYVLWFGVVLLLCGCR